MANTDVAHISFARGVTPYFYTWACILRKARVIVQTHGMLTSRASTPQRVLDSFFTKPLIKRAQAIVALTEFEQAALSTWCPEISNKITVVGNPSQASLLKKVQEPVPGTALFAARLHPRKRVIDFANASKFSFESQWEEKYFALGPDEGDLPRLQAISAKVPNLQYLGATDTIGALDQICTCAVFVLSSENEPWGNALVAALSIGRPVVITESSHLSGLVQIYQAGIVVPDRDPEAIARAVHDICASSNYAQFSKNASMLSLLHFSDNTIQRQLLELYGDC
jgi:glycosyltransferase involved in cell wall biosynthesis